MRRLARLAVVGVALLLALVMAEVALRAIDYRYSPVKIGDSVQSDFREQHAFHDRNLVYDRDLIWRPHSGQFSPFNPQGFRGAPVDPQKPSGRLRIVAVGDSNTFGWDVDEGANWPSQLQNLLVATRPGAEVLNAGVWGYTAFQGLARVKEMMAFNPDIVLVSFGGNDAHQVRVADADYVRRHDRIDRLTRATRQVRLAQLGVAGWDLLGMAMASDTLVPRVSLDDYRSHLRAMIALARERGITIVLLTRPFIGSSTDPASWKTHAPAYNAATIEIGRAEKVTVIDIYAAFHSREALFDDESHFGVEGHRLAAEFIYDRLQRLVAP